jgi:hypothetical protein
LIQGRPARLSRGWQRAPPPVAWRCSGRDEKTAPQPNQKTSIVLAGWRTPRRPGTAGVLASLGGSSLSLAVTCLSETGSVVRDFRVSGVGFGPQGRLNRKRRKERKWVCAEPDFRANLRLLHGQALRVSGALNGPTVAPSQNRPDASHGPMRSHRHFARGSDPSVLRTRYARPKTRSESSFISTPSPCICVHLRQKFLGLLRSYRTLPTEGH